MNSMKLDCYTPALLYRISSEVTTLVPQLLKINACLQFGEQLKRAMLLAQMGESSYENFVWTPGESEDNSFPMPTHQCLPH